MKEDLGFAAAAAQPESVAGHMPGPWLVRETASYFAVQAGHRGRGKGTGRTVAGCYKPHATAEADACLISAAPDLLEALKTIIDGVEGEDSEDPVGVILLPLYNREIAAARAAIAKATP